MFLTKTPGSLSGRLRKVAILEDDISASDINDNNIGNITMVKLKYWNKNIVVYAEPT